MKHTASLGIALFCLLGGAVLRFAMPGRDFLGYTLWALGLLVFLFPRLHAGGRVALAVLVIAGLAVFTALELPIVRAARTDPDPKADYVIVLGAGVNGSTPSLSMLDRLTAALDYLNTYPDAVAIVSGGQGTGEDITEAAAMHAWLTQHGVDESRIVQEPASTSTRSNLENSFAIIRARGGEVADGVAIVTSEYHLYRAKWMAEALGARPLGVAARTGLIPMRVNYFIREAFAAAYLRVAGIGA